MSHVVYSIPRNSLVWLLVSVALAMLPHFGRLPTWMLGVVLVVIIWRVQVFRQRWSFPNKWLRVSFVFGGAAGIFSFYGTLLGPDAGVALLALAYTFKLLEMYKERDAYLIVILSFFVLATNYLFDRGLISTFYSLFVTVIVTASLVGLNQSRFNTDFKRTFKLAGRMMAHSVPLMLILFLLVPRIGPLWSMNLDRNKSKTGISDRMTPGDISELTKSSELAFRAEILGGPTPNKKDLYWRGAVFSYFDGRTWSVDKSKFKKIVDPWSRISMHSKESLGKVFNYRVFLEPTNQEWVFTIPFGEVHSGDINPAENLTWTKLDPITSSISYEATSYPEFENSPSKLDWEEKQKALQLPPSGDIRARSWALTQYGKSGSNPEAYIKYIFDYFHTESFSYTLRPTPLYSNTIDQFLFSTRNGFCTHYAGAFVFLLRAAGIPARMVGGYQGGSIHESGAYITVRQYAAHAWTEAWIAGKGWVRYDPTMAVAPSRIFDGIEGMPEDENFLADSPFSPYKVRNWPVLSKIRRSFEHMDYLWTKWVVGYNTKSQVEFLGRFLGNVTPKKLAYALVFIGGACVLLFAILLLREKPLNRLNRVDKLYLIFCKKLARKGLERRPQEGPIDFANRISKENPGIQDKVAKITELYVSIQYQKPLQDTEINANQRPKHDRLAPLYLELKKEIKSLKV